jgi:hypothetical protein
MVEKLRVGIISAAWGAVAHLRRGGALTTLMKSPFAHLGVKLRMMRHATTA